MPNNKSSIKNICQCTQTETKSPRKEEISIKSEL